MTGPVGGDRPLSEEARKGNPELGDEAREEAAKTDDAYRRTTDEDSADNEAGE